MLRSGPFRKLPVAMALVSILLLGALPAMAAYTASLPGSGAAPQGTAPTPTSSPAVVSPAQLASDPTAFQQANAEFLRQFAASETINQAGAPAAPSAAAAPDAGSVSYAFTWVEQSKITVVEWWNAQGRAACSYAANPWPATELAAERAYVLGARQVLRDEMRMGDWIAANRAATSEVRIHGAETNCPIVNGTPHLDYPPHVHIFYLSLTPSGGWQHINSHQYPDASGRITAGLVIPNLCGLTSTYTPVAGQWVDLLDEQCTAAWQERFTTTGQLELRRPSTGPTYALQIRPLNPATPDLAGVDVINSTTGQTLYTIDITAYDPINFYMQASITDLRSGIVSTETWRGDPSTMRTLVSHTVTQSGGGAGTPAPTATPVPAATLTPPPTPLPAGATVRRLWLPLLSR